MNQPEGVLLVRFKTSLSLEEVNRVAEERAPTGLHQIAELPTVDC